MVGGGSNPTTNDRRPDRQPTFSSCRPTAHEGFGTLINGLASLLLGEAIIGNRTTWRQITALVLGSVVYFELISVSAAVVPVQKA